MLTDPRLLNPVLLALAAQRLLARRDHPPPVPWWETEGLAALLAAAQHRPHRESRGEVDDPDAPGLAGLLARARLALKHKEEQYG